MIDFVNIRSNTKLRKKLDSGQTAYHIHLHNHQLFAFAGLWEAVAD